MPRPSWGAQLAGTYLLTEVGDHCSTNLHRPSECAAHWQPPTTLKIPNFPIEHEVQTASNAKLKELDYSWQLFAKSTVGYILPADKFRRTLCEELLHREQHCSNRQSARNAVEVVGHWPVSLSRFFFRQGFFEEGHTACALR